MTTARQELGSFRDPSGTVFSHDGRIFRTVTQFAAERFDFVRATALLDEFAEQGRLVTTTLVEAPSAMRSDDVCYVVEHPRLPFISYPYEWCFSALKAAALHHLDIHLDALARGVTLSDASALNPAECETVVAQTEN